MQPLEGPFHDARTADADVNHRVGRAFAVKAAGHEGIIFGRVGEDAELGAAEPLAVGRGFRQLADFLTEDGDGRHVDAGLGRRRVDRGADALRRREGRGQAFEVIPGGSRQPAVHEGRIAADEIDLHGFGRFVEHLGHADHAVGIEAVGNPHDGRDGQAAMNDGDAVAGRDVGTGLFQLVSRAANGFGDEVAGAGHVAVDAA